MQLHSRLRCCHGAGRGYLDAEHDIDRKDYLESIFLVRYYYWGGKYRDEQCKLQLLQLAIRHGADLNRIEVVLNRFNQPPSPFCRASRAAVDDPVNCGIHIESAWLPNERKPLLIDELHVYTSASPVRNGEFSAFPNEEVTFSTEVVFHQFREHSLVHFLPVLSAWCRVAAEQQKAK